MSYGTIQLPVMIGTVPSSSKGLQLLVLFVELITGMLGGLAVWKHVQIFWARLPQVLVEPEVP